MTNRNALLGRSRPREKLPRRLRRPRRGNRASRAAGKAAWEEGWWYAADGTQGSAEVSLEPRVPWLRFQDHRQWPAPARATSGEVRPLQSGPRPGRRAIRKNEHQAVSIKEDPAFLQLNGRTS